jgi:hypothetical protein
MCIDYCALTFFPPLLRSDSPSKHSSIAALEAPQHMSAKKRSLYHQRKQAEQTLLSLPGQQTRSKTKEMLVKAPPTKLSLAITANMPEVFVSIGAILIMEQVLDKRYHAELKQYQYLVKYKGLDSMWNSWVNPGEIKKVALVKEFEEQKSALVTQKKHIAAWYPLNEQLVVQWKDHSFFIVSHGSGELNNFCVVGINKLGTGIICKHTNHPNIPQHQVHVQLVEKEMEKLKLRIWNKTRIGSVFEVQNCPEEQLELQKSKRNWIEHPASTTSITLTSIESIHTKRLQHYQGSPTLVQEFKPESPPRFCKCVSHVGSGTDTAEICCTVYKTAPDLIIHPKGTTLWLPQGPPVTGCRIFVWKCQNNNAECTQYYDGYKDGIFNYNNVTLVSHVVLFEFLLGLVSGYVCFSSFNRCALISMLFSVIFLTFHSML